MRQTLSFLTLILLYASSAPAHEVYTLISNNCQTHQGLLLKVDENKIHLVDLNGRLKTTMRESIDFLVIHNTLENPIKSLSINTEMQSLMRAVHYNESDQALFSGWPVRFIEDLVIFYDEHGKNHVLELFKISKIRPVETKAALKSRARARTRTKTKFKSNAKDSFVRTKKLTGKAFKFSLGDLPSKCLSLKQKFSPKGVQPTRILADKIHISEFLSNFEEGFEKFYSYQERTYLYAKPYLYEKRSKLGFLIYPDYFEMPPGVVFPMYFQWSTGQPYRFQSFTRLGGQSIEWAPSMEPISAIRSDLKSHVFHASFVGNLGALPAGTEYFTEYKDEIFKQKKVPDVLKGTLENNIAHSAVAFNYMALMGGDWGPWSVSIGTFYPTFMILVKDQFREVLASNTTPIFRLRYIRPKWSLRAVVSRTDLASDNVNDLELVVDKNTSSVGQISQFSLESQFLRLGGDYQVNSDLSVGLDQLFLTGQYREILASGDRDSLDFNHFQTSAYVRHKFGYYVTLKVFVNLLKYEQDFDFVGVASGQETEDEMVTGGYFEFVF